MADRTNRFLTETAAMRTLTLSSPRGDLSFKIGLGLVALFAAIEIFSASYYYMGRVSATPAAAQPSIASRPAVATPPPVTRKPIAAPSVAATTAPVVAAASPTPAPPATAASRSAVSAEERLLREATELTNRGDTVNALNRLQQAAEKDPKNAQVLAEMAKIYESTQNFERSNEMWRKVQEVGVSAGALYELAETKLKRGSVATPAPVAPPPVQATPAETFAFSGSEGIPDGSTFGVSDVVTTETPDTEAETNLMLRISVKKRPNAVVDHTKVKIQVYFYDTVEDRDIKLTDADVNYEWLTPNHDWTQSNPEILAVTYLRQRNKTLSQEAALSAAAAAVNPNKKGKPVKAPTSDTSDSGRRRYLGYIVRIYYNDKLQAVRAEPTKLLNLFPPPSTTSSP